MSLTRSKYFVHDITIDKIDLFNEMWIMQLGNFFLFIQSLINCKVNQDERNNLEENVYFKLHWQMQQRKFILTILLIQIYQILE